MQCWVDRWLVFIATEWLYHVSHVCPLGVRLRAIVNKASLDGSMPRLCAHVPRFSRVSTWEWPRRW